MQFILGERGGGVIESQANFGGGEGEIRGKPVLF